MEIRISRLIRAFTKKNGSSKAVAIAGSVVLIIQLALVTGAPLITNLPAPGNSISGFFSTFQSPNMDHPMGTNDIGQDEFTRVLYGGVVPLQIALMSTSLAGCIGILVGLFSGYRAGKIDRVASSLMDTLYAFPGIILAIAITAMLGPNLLNTTIALAVIYIPSFYRMTRAQTLQLREVTYVEAARSIGESTFSILMRYILPDIFSAIAVLSSMSFADAILTEAGLSFVGLPAVTPPAPEWGYDLVIGRINLISGAWWLVVFPGLMIILSVLGFSLLGEGLNEMYKPRLK